MKNEPTSTPPSARWIVMGHAAFAREDVVVGEFDTEEEAQACVREKETSAGQAAPMRGTFWIVPKPQS